MNKLEVPVGKMSVYLDFIFYTQEEKEALDIETLLLTREVAKSIADFSKDSHPRDASFVLEDVNTLTSIIESKLN